MSDEHVKSGERRAEQIQAATWYVDEYIGTVIYARNPFGSGNDFKVADIRGWGHLTGQGALRMDSSAAEITQMALATHIVNCHNSRADLAAERERKHQWYFEWLYENAFDLRSIDDPPDDYHYVVIEHYMAEPHERIIGAGRTPIEAIEDALRALATHEHNEGEL